MHHNDITSTFLGYFAERGHHVLPDASLIPSEQDPSGLFINSGMHTIKPYFFGAVQPSSKRLTSTQKCLRTGDIDSVGRNRRTLTFFSMLGSWSIGDYWKDEAIPFAYGLLTDKFGLDQDKLWVTYFSGDGEIPADTETKEKWERILSTERVIGLGKDQNFWAAGATGLCGPCTEVLYDRGPEYGCKSQSCKPGCDCDRYLEIWNAGVFIQYDRQPDGQLLNLPFKSIDTGAGLERIAAVLQKKDSVYETTVFAPIVEQIMASIGQQPRAIMADQSTRYVRVIADHLRASSTLLAEGIVPSNTDRGYVLRRLLRRSINYASLLGISSEGIQSIAEKIVTHTGQDYKYLISARTNVIDGILTEHKKFIKTLGTGKRLLEQAITRIPPTGQRRLDASIAFKLYERFGFPFELTQELCIEHGIQVDATAFSSLVEAHRAKSRASASAMFASGLAEITPETTRYHTTTHILHQALRDKFGTSIQQKGSNITKERLRFDFAFGRPLEADEISELEAKVNEVIGRNLPVTRQEMAINDALASGALAFFGDKYGETVTVYSVGGYSKEVCRGPHVNNTSELGKFKIQKEESSGAGVRRIKAILI